MTCFPQYLHGYSQSNVSVRYTISLASPACFTRGTHIPIHLEIACKDSDSGSASESELRSVLDSLVQPRVLGQSVSLVQRISSFRTPDSGGLARYLLSADSSKKKSMKRTAETVIADARFSFSSSSLEGMRKRKSEDGWHVVSLNGEIHLSSGLPPSSSFPLHSVEVSIFCLIFGIRLMGFSIGSK